MLLAVRFGHVGLFVKAVVFRVVKSEKFFFNCFIALNAGVMRCFGHPMSIASTMANNRQLLTWLPNKLWCLLFCRRQVPLSWLTFPRTVVISLEISSIGNPSMSLA